MLIAKKTSISKTSVKKNVISKTSSQKPSLSGAQSPISSGTITFVIATAEIPIVYISIGVSNYTRVKQFYQDIFHFEMKFDAGEELDWCELELLHRECVLV